MLKNQDRNKENKEKQESEVDSVVPSLLGSVANTTNTLAQEKINRDKKKRQDNRERSAELRIDKQPIIFVNSKIDSKLENDSKYHAIIAEGKYTFSEDCCNPLYKKSSLTTTKGNRLEQLFSFLTVQTNMKTNSAHNSEKWLPMGLNIEGDIEFLEDKKMRKESPNLSKTIICNPYAKNISIVNNYTITDENFSTSMKTKNGKIMLFNLFFPLLDVLNKKYKNDTNGMVSVSTNVINYYHNKAKQVKVIEVCSGNSGKITIYFTKSETLLISAFNELKKEYQNLRKSEREPIFV